MSEDEGCPIIKGWNALPFLVSRASGGKLATVGKEMNRQSVSENAEILEPVIATLGTRPALQQLVDVVGRFFFLCRARGKKHPTSHEIKTEAWILKRLVSLFAGVVRRPHVPRDPELRRLFQLVGIDVTPSRSSESLGDAEHHGGDPEDHDDDPDHEECEEEEMTNDEMEEEEQENEEGDPEELPPVPPVPEVKGEDPAPALSKESLESSKGIVTPSPRNRFHSPSTGETGEKQPRHNVVKCGFFCVKCKSRHSNSKVICFASCVDEKTNHVLVEASHVCTQCFALGHKSELEGSPCHVAAATAEKPDIPEKEAKVTVKETDRPAVAAVGVSKTKPDHPKGYPEKKLIDELKIMENEIKRLQLLKTLQVERERLAQMIAMKNKVSTDVTDTLPMEAEESTALAALEVEKSGTEASSSRAGHSPQDTAILASKRFPEPASTANKSKGKIDKEEPKGVKDDVTPNDKSKGMIDKEEPKEKPKGDTTVTIPTVLKTEASISPAEQLKQITGKEPKSRGRPKKEKVDKASKRIPPASKAKAKAKARSQRANAKAKSASKAAKAKPTKSSSSRKRPASVEPAAHEVEEETTNTGFEGEEEEELAQDDEVDVPQNDAPCSKGERRKRKAPTEQVSKSKEEEPKHLKRKASRGSLAKDDLKPTKGNRAKKNTRKAKAKDEKAKDDMTQDEETKDEETKARKAETKNGKGNTRKGKKNKVEDPDPAKAAKKALLSRKSCAYKKARSIARANGLSEEDAVAAAKKAYAECK